MALKDCDAMVPHVCSGRMKQAVLLVADVSTVESGVAEPSLCVAVGSYTPATSIITTCVMLM